MDLGGGAAGAPCDTLFVPRGLYLLQTDHLGGALAVPLSDTALRQLELQ
jgi:hypothetical protein